MEIRVIYHNAPCELAKIEQGDWIDLYVSERVEMKQWEYRLIPLGISMEIPEGYEANIVPRSSTFKKYGILQTNSFGVIDNSYCGDGDLWYFPAFATRDTVIERGDRICQFRLNRTMSAMIGEPIRFVPAETLGHRDRGGFGSTGV